jgi:hypothetical protein
MKQLVGCAGRPRTAAARRVEDVGGGWAAKEVSSLAAVVLHGRGEEAGVRARQGEERCAVLDRDVAAAWEGRGVGPGLSAGCRGGRAGGRADARAERKANARTTGKTTYQFFHVGSFSLGVD